MIQTNKNTQYEKKYINYHDYTINPVLLSPSILTTPPHPFHASDTYMYMQHQG